VSSLAVFACAAFLEIAGCFAFWAWFRKGASGSTAALGVLSLVAFAVVLTRADAAFAGRAYAAYGGHLHRRFSCLAMGRGRRNAAQY